MSRVWLMSVVLVSVIVPSVAQAQTYLVYPPAGLPTIICGPQSSAEPPIYTAYPPAGLPTVIYGSPSSIPPSVYVAPAPAPRTPIDPWIPLAVRPAPTTNTLDLVTQMLVLQELAAAQRQYTAPEPVMPVPAPVPPSTSSDGWMGGFIKGVKKER